MLSTTRTPNAFSVKNAVVIMVAFRPGPPPLPSQSEAIPVLTDWAEKRGRRLLYASPEAFEERDGALWVTGTEPETASDTWRSVESRVALVYNRFPRSRDPEAFAQVAELCQKHNVPFGNPPSLQGLVWDKAVTGRQLLKHALPVPRWVEAVDAFLPALKEWGRAYLKPTTGAFGDGITVWCWKDGRVFVEEGPGQTREMSEGEALLEWRDLCEQPHLLQQAIEPPFPGVRGLSIRSLLQRTEEGAWLTLPRVARVSSADPVANAARGATPLPCEDVFAEQWEMEAVRELLERLQTLETLVAQSLMEALPPAEAEQVVELGLDFVVDPERGLWVLEANGFPQGRLERLLLLDRQRFESHFAQGHSRPLQRLLSLTAEQGA